MNTRPTSGDPTPTQIRVGLPSPATTAVAWERTTLLRHTKFFRVSIAAAILAALTVGLITTDVVAGPPLGANSITPTTGTSSTVFSLAPPAGAACTGSGSNGYRWQTYMVDAGVDASTLTYLGGPVAVNGHFVLPLFTSDTGDAVIDKNPSASPAGLISGIPTFSFASVVGPTLSPPVANGVYKIGFACTSAGNIEAGHYWETPITISGVTNSGFNYAIGAVPSAPVLASVSAGNTTLDGSFTAAVAIPAVTGFTVTAHPASGSDVVLAVAAGATTFHLTGLVNGTQYGVSLIAANARGNSVASNTINATPVAGTVPAAPVLGSTIVSGDTTLDGTFTPGASAPATTGFTVTAVPSAGTTVTLALGASATSFHLTGLVNGTQYAVTVKATNGIGASLSSNSVNATPHGVFQALNPGRLLETRVGPDLTTADGLFEGIGVLAAGSVTELQVAGRAGVPADAASVVLNVTATDPAAAGYITVFPCGSTRPTASSLNYVTGATVPNAVIAKLGAGKICFYTSQSTDLIVDINGYFPASATLVALNPARILETRSGLSTIDGLDNAVGALAANSVFELPVTGRAGVVAGAAAAVLNVTVTEAQGPGFVTVFPCGSDRPTTSSLNYVTGSTVANAVVSKIGAGGKICFYTQAATHLVVDVAGYLPGDGSFTPIVPERMLETRPGLSTVDGLFNGIGAPASGSVTEVQIGGRPGVPANATAVALNVTVTGPIGPGFITVFPCGSPRPQASNLNYTAGLTVPNAVIAKVGTAGKVCFYTSQSTDLIVDINGYFSAP